MTNRVEQLYSKNPDPAVFAKGYLDYLSEVLTLLNTDEIASFINVLLDARERGSRIIFLGNGGSAATASHFVNDIAIGSRTWEKPFRALALTDNVAVITAIGNDYSYEDIFVRQLMTLLEADDVVVAISVSGNSANVVKAIDYANEKGAITIGLTGFDGGKLRQKAQLNVHAITNRGEYGPAEDVHMILDHLVGNYIIHKVKEEQAAADLVAVGAE